MSTVLQRRGFLASIAAVVASPLVEFAAPVKPPLSATIINPLDHGSGGALCMAWGRNNVIIRGAVIRQGQLYLRMNDGTNHLIGEALPFHMPQAPLAIALNSDVLR
jgi:hypothetical protein